MKKTLVNYWVDLATGIAFVFCAVTGVVFLFPGTVHTAIGSTPTILLIPATWWHTVHDWTGVAMVAGTALHLALHAKWIAVMTRKVFGSPAGAEPARATPPGRVAQPALVAGAAARMAAETPTYRTAADAEAAATASLERLDDLRADRLRERAQRISRRRFLTGAAAVGAGVLLAGVGIFGKDAVSSASTRLRDEGWIAGGQGQSGAGTSSGGATDGGETGSASVGSSAQDGSSAGTSTATTVSVDQSACVACGRCLQVCPQGVFDWSSSGRADAVSPDACIRCGRCLQVCPAGAITVNA
jgi:NAD-dependent dihydropyrimidine dehydrogenase PreA subunit